MGRLSDRLSKFHRHIVPSALDLKGTPEISAVCPPRYRRLADAVGGHVISNDSGAFVVVETTYGADYVHGRVTLGGHHAGSSLPLEAFSLKRRDGAVDLSSAMFLDVEATGLGGAGTIAFLIGIGSWRHDKFTVRQYLLPDYPDEAGMLEKVYSDFESCQYLLTYNGAAYDLPLLRDRMIINRVARELKFTEHIDLLHPVRRLFRRRLSSCTLGNAERALFEFERKDDLPGYLVPSVYFDWLSSENVTQIGAVLEHNRLDIVSLYFLAGHIAGIYSSGGECLEHIDDMHSLSRIYARQRDYDRVTKLYRRMEQEDGGRISSDALFFHGLTFKRQGNHNEASRLFRIVAGQSDRPAYWANIELAKHCEHRLRDFPAAVQFAEKARLISPYGAGHEKKLSHRLRRLRSKMDR